MANTHTTQQLERRVASLAHSLALAQAVSGKRGIAKRNAIRQLHHTDVRSSHGPELDRSNPHVSEPTRRRNMKIRAEHTGAQRVMRRRSRDVYEGELDTELIEAADVACDFDFDKVVEQVPDLPNEGV